MALGVRKACCPPAVLAGEAVSCLELVEAGGVCGTRHGGSGFCFTLGLSLRFIVLLSLFFAQSCAPAHFFSENSRLKLARDLGRGKLLFLT